MSDAYLRWATSTNYSAPGKAWDATPTKVIPVDFANGFSPNQRPAAQHWNWLMNQTKILADAIYNTGIEFIRPASNLAALTAMTSVPTGVCAHVKGYGLYTYTLGDTSTTVVTNFILRDDANAGTWFHSLATVRGAASGLVPLSSASKIASTYGGATGTIATLDSSGLVPRAQINGMTLTAVSALAGSTGATGLEGNPVGVTGTAATIYAYTAKTTAEKALIVVEVVGYNDAGGHKVEAWLEDNDGNRLGLSNKIAGDGVVANQWVNFTLVGSLASGGTVTGVVVKGKSSGTTDMYVAGISTAIFD